MIIDRGAACLAEAGDEVGVHPGRIWTWTRSSAFRAAIPSLAKGRAFALGEVAGVSLEPTPSAFA